MRLVFLAPILALSLLTACGQPAPATAPDAAPAAAGQAMSTGLMGGFSDAATGELGALEVRADALQFTDGEGAPSVSAATEFLGVVDAAGSIAAGGQSFAASAPGLPSSRVELRSIAGAPPAALCWGDKPATHVALAHDEPLTALTVIVFSGADAPSPSARDSTLCATYSYAVE